jgi:prefoldin subunit 5
VLGVGAGISIQRTPEETERILDGKIDELSQAFKKISERASQLESMINELSDKIQNEYAAMQTPDKT